MTQIVTLAILSNFLTALFALIAAYFWYRSATVQVPCEDKSRPDGIYPAAIIAGGNIDFFRTDEVRSVKSRRGAYAAASFLQFLALLLQSVAWSS